MMSSIPLFAEIIELCGQEIKKRDSSISSQAFSFINTSVIPKLGFKLVTTETASLRKLILELAKEEYSKKFDGDMLGQLNEIYEIINNRQEIRIEDDFAKIILPVFIEHAKQAMPDKSSDIEACSTNYLSLGAKSVISEVSLIVKERIAPEAAHVAQP